MAQRVQMKRSSVLGKRPNNQYLEPGELALNTNQSDPGLFFETNTGDIAKVGPTYIGISPPQTEVGYGPGETWLDSGNGTMNIWVPALNKWVPVQSPLFGGATTAIFVGSEFPEASDDLSNDGIARPFATLNRAMVEVARRSILSGRFDELYNGQFTILLLPGRNVVYNEPGVEFSEFEQLVSGFQSDQTITQAILRLFNSVTGGLLVPRGTSIVALDLRKTELRPTYYPLWTRLKYEYDPTSIEPRTSILKWTGNTYLTSFTFKDKVEIVSVTSISGDADDVAVLRSARPHGFRTLVTSQSSSSEVVAADRVTLFYPLSVPQLYDNEPVTSAGDYYADPIDAYTFRLRRTTGDASTLLRRELPQFGTPGANPPEFLTLTYPLTTHHRLSAIKFATTTELNEYYTKVQRAFSLLNFSGTVNNAEVAPGETDIVASVTENPTFSLDKVENSSPYILNCSLRSDWGMSGTEVDGDLVTGFKSALFCNFTAVSLQNDAETYEVYDAISKSWIGLKDRYSVATNTPLSLVTNVAAMEYMISQIKVEDIRYFFRPKLDITSDDQKSSGLTDSVSDTRNYSVQTSNGGFSQVVGSFAIGVAVNYWALSGGSMSVQNANSNFGGMAIRSEGFKGIGTAGGAETPDKNFIVKGIRRPSVITQQMVADANNIQKIYFNGRIVSTTTNTITFDVEINTESLLPYTLRPGSCVWVQSTESGVAYSAQITSAESVLSPDKKTLYVSADNNGIHGSGLDLSVASLPYLRRFIDPRPGVDKQYSLWIGGSIAANRAPEYGFILRFSQDTSSNLLRPGVQLDPGQTGGWNHVFQVIDTRTKAEGDNPNGTEPLIVPSASSGDYYVTFLAVDSAHPWIPSGNNGFSTTTDINYPRGAYSTYNQRVFYAMENDQAISALKPLPTDAGTTTWTRAKVLEYCQDIEQTWMHAEGYTSADDPMTASYAEDNVVYTYARGVQYETGNYALDGVIDIDDGTATLGIISGNIAQTSLYDPWWGASKMAMTRFLSLLGFSYSQINTLLQPQYWTSRNVAVASMPAVGTTGYALATGQWGIEFNRPSAIRSGNHAWEWSGYLNYAKGLPRYQTSQLSVRERFDSMFTGIWGGIASATGTDERDEFVITGKAVAGGSGLTLLTTAPTSGQSATTVPIA